MKTVLSNRFMQWAGALLLGCGITLLFFSVLPPNAVKDTAVIDSGLPEAMPVEPATPPAAPSLSQRITEYHMAVTLVPEKKLLQGAQTVTWKNPGKTPVSELYFHLYPNAFNSENTTFNKESGGKLRNDRAAADSFGGIDILSLKTAQGEDLVPRIRYVQPDDGNEQDRTLLKVPLSEPVAPGESVTLTLEFHVRLPRVYARMGYSENDFFMAGQWFPKLAAYEKSGTRGRTDDGWNLHQYHGNSEFYANFGIYNVKIRVPSDYTVAATGFPTKPASDDGKMKTYRFYAEDVHDFAWAASPNFIYAEEPFSAPNVPGVKIKLYLDPAHEHLKNRYLQAAKKSLARFSDWYGPYPYSTLSIVVPPKGAGGAGGMEYPTLITAWAAETDTPGLELERVVVHEIGHQFFYGMVATNEFEEAWLDEGFTSYAEDKLMELEYAVKPNLPLEAVYVTSPAPLRQHAWEYASHSVYGENAYTRAKLVLTAIEREIGEDAMKRVLKTYFQRWKFKHPSTADFQRTLEDVTKRSWQAFFDQFVYDGQMLDYSVEGIQIRELKQAGKSGYESRVLIRKNGAQHHMVPIRFHFSDGTRIDKIWDSDGSEILFKLVHDSPVVWVQIDPEHTLTLENKRINNFLKTDVPPETKSRWNIGTTKLLELLLSWFAW